MKCGICKKEMTPAEDCGGDCTDCMRASSCDVTCDGCGKTLNAHDAIIEEGDRWECPECWEKFEAIDRADAAARAKT